MDGETEEQEITSREKRKEIIKTLEESGDSKVITYITGTRPGMEFNIAIDSIRKIYDHLVQCQKEDGEKPNIDLFLHSNGGDSIVPWKIVSLIRNYSKRFRVIVPHRAFSAATLISLGADEIIMHPMGMLGPIDPTVTNSFNPKDPMNNPIGISVEDVVSYAKLFREDFKINHEDQVMEAFSLLAKEVHPLALGNVKRFHSQSRMLAKKLLKLHTEEGEDHKISEIVEKLTSKLFFHGHPISLKEAQEMGLKAVEPKNKKTETAIWDLYLEYEKDMQLDCEFRPVDEFIDRVDQETLNRGGVAVVDFGEIKGVYVESLSHADVRKLKCKIAGGKNQNGSESAQLLVHKQSWEKEK